MLRTIDEVIDKYPTIKFKGYSTWDEENPIKLPFNHAFINLKGQKFNHLTVLELFPFKSKDNRPLWIVECDCDAHTIFVVSGKSLRNGNTKSCGCNQAASLTARNTKHGLAQRNRKSRAYSIYVDMIRRCYNPNRSEYARFGAKGIQVSDDWRGENGFTNFYQWSIDHGYQEQDHSTPNDELLVLIRINANGNYTPNNCEWVPKKKQWKNKTSNHHFIFAGIDMTSAELFNIFDVTTREIGAKLYTGWTSNEIIHYLISEKFEKGAAKAPFNNSPHTEDGYGVIIPNYADMNPWSDNLAERNFARSYLSNDIISQLEILKKRKDK